MTRSVAWSTLVLQADPDHARDARILPEYDYAAPGGTKSDKVYKDGRRVFEADYRTRGAYAVFNGYSAEALQFFTRVSDPGTTRKNLYAALIDALVSAGVWAKLDALYVLAAADAPTAQTNLVQSPFGLIAVGAPGFTSDHGYTPALGGVYLNTGFIPSSAAGRMTQDDASIFTWSLGTDNVLNAGSIGGGANPYIDIYPRANDQLAIYLNDNLGSAFASTDGSGFLAGVRTASNNVNVYRNGVLIGVSPTASNGLPTAPLHLLADDSGRGFTGGNQLVGGFGAGLSDAQVSALYNALHTYLHTVAGLL